MDHTISRAGAEALDRLRPLWLALHHHHQAVGGERLGPYVDDDASWAARRALYEEFLSRGVTIARDICDQPYGCRDFDVEDCNGYRLCFGQDIEG